MVRAVQALQRNIASWLKPGGMSFVHIFTHRNLAYHFEVRCLAASNAPRQHPLLFCMFLACAHVR